LPTFAGGNDLGSGTLNSAFFEFNNTGLGALLTTTVDIGAKLTVRVAGPITQSAPITCVGAEFTVLGNFGITINNALNNITSLNVFNNGISLNTPFADASTASNVTFVGSGDLWLDDCNIGLGKDPAGLFAIDISATGDIQQNAATKFIQKEG